MSDVVGQRAQVAHAFEQPTLALLHQKHAPVVLAILRTSFAHDTSAVPTGRFHEQIETYLHELRLAGVAALPPSSDGRELANTWRNHDWLYRDFDDAGNEVYTLSSAAQTALGLVARMTRERSVVSEHRIATIVAAAHRFNAAANPDRDARIRILKGEIKARQGELERLQNNEPLPAVNDDYMATGYLEILDLVADLPSDFARVGEALAGLRTTVMADFLAADHTGGQVIDRYLATVDDLMDATPEGRAFEGAFTLLRDDELLVQLRTDLADLLEHPAAAILDDAERARIRGVVATIRAGLGTVLAQRRRVSKSLKDYIVTHDLAHDRQLDATLRALEAQLLTWMANAGPRSYVTIPLLPEVAEVTTLRRRLYDPAESVAPDPHDLPEADRPDVPTLAELRTHGGPTFDQLRQQLIDAMTGPDQMASLAGLFDQLPDTLRRPVEILGLLALAADEDHLTDAGREAFHALRSDGTTRTFDGPRIVPTRENTA